MITVGGDCAVDIAPIAAARVRYGAALTVLWVDAHPDVYSPQTLPSGAFHGMVVRALLGDGPAGLTPGQPLEPSQVIITGERAGDVSEHEYLTKTGLRRHGVDDLEQALDGLRGPVYAHIDLDVLAPAVFGSTCYPEPNGVQPQRLIDLIGQLDNIIGAAITEHAPSTDDVNGDGPGDPPAGRRAGRLTIGRTRLVSRPGRPSRPEGNHGCPSGSQIS